MLVIQPDTDTVSDKRTGERTLKESPGGRYYRPELDVLRFGAFVLVFMAHTLGSVEETRVQHLLKGFASVFFASVAACRFGLNLFFTLSAFLICELLIREKETTSTVRIEQFYVRRILRIWPLYYLGLAIGVGAALLPGGDPRSIAAIGWFAIFLSTWTIPAHGVAPNPVFPLWSISVEEQFYLMAPWLLKYLNRKALYVFCFVVLLVSNIWLFQLGSVRAPLFRIWANSFVEFEPFAAGILLCLLLRGRLPRIAVWQRFILAAGGWLLWLYACSSLSVVFDPHKNPGSWSLIGGYALGALGSVLMVMAFLGIDPSLLPRWAIYLGRISFGLYAYHQFAIYVTSRFLTPWLTSIPIPSDRLRPLRGFGLDVLAPFVLTVVTASLSYRFYESRFLKLKKRFTVIESQPIAGARPL
ncbi:MAG: acyltransferase [Terracidiphilus sp.]